MTHLSLFSGIGGDSIAAHWAGFETIAFCEIDPFCQKVLAKHWKGVPIYDDITTFTGHELRGRVDLLTGGFPCQDISAAGRQAGLTGKRSGLWFEMLRVIAQARPAYVVAENVAALIGMGIDVCLSGMENEGYAARAVMVPACGVGAYHQRQRVFIIAKDISNADSQRESQPERMLENITGRTVNGSQDVCDTECRRFSGQSRGRSRQKFEDRCENVCNAASRGVERELSSRREARGFSGTSTRATEPRLGGIVNGIPEILDGGGLNDREWNEAQSAESIPGYDKLREVRSHDGAISSSSRFDESTSIDRNIVLEVSRTSRSGIRQSTEEENEAVQDLREVIYPITQQEAYNMQQGMFERDRKDKCLQEMEKNLRPWGRDWEDGTPRVGKGIPMRVQRLKALGNAIVPQQIYPILVAIANEIRSANDNQR